MKTSILIFASLLFFSSLFVTAQNDSISIGKKKQFFIGLDAGFGLGWRINKNIPDSLVFSRINSDGEKPG